MASWIRALLTSTFLAFYIATPSAQAAPAPIVFDFEDGLQGWKLHDSAQRVQTQVLGGEWAIFGDGRILETGISFQIDVTDLVVISIHTHGIGSFADSLEVTVPTAPVDPLPSAILLHLDTRLLSKTFFLRDLDGLHTISIAWRGIDFIPNCQPSGCTDPAIPFVGFIDNITFHPVPEPSTLTLLAVSLASLGIYRRRSE